MNWVQIIFVFLFVSCSSDVDLMSSNNEAQTSTAIDRNSESDDGIAGGENDQQQAFGDLDDLDDQDDLIEPVQITGAALTCQVSNPGLVLCNLDAKNVDQYDLTLYDENLNEIDSSQYTIEKIDDADAYWNVSVSFAKPLPSFAVKATKEGSSSASEIDGIEVSESNVLDVTESLKIHEILSIDYESKEWGDLALLITENSSVSGVYAYDNLKGSLTGTFDTNTMVVIGRYSERNAANNSLVEEGDFRFEFSIDSDGEISVVGQYREDGEKKWGPWSLSPKS